MDFNSSYTYSINFETGACRGSFLKVDSLFQSDYVSSNTRKVAVHDNDSSTNWIITPHYYSSYGSNYFAGYYLQPADGEFQGWYLSEILLKGNVGLLVIVQNFSGKSELWDLNLTEKDRSDKAKRSIRNMQSYRYLHSDKNGSRRRDKVSYTPFTHPNQKNSGGQVCWRIQVVGTSNAMKKKIQSLQNDIRSLSQSYQKSTTNQNYYISRCSQLQNQMSSSNSNYSSQIANLNRSIASLGLKKKEKIQQIYTLGNWREAYNQLKQRVEVYMQEQTEIATMLGAEEGKVQNVMDRSQEKLREIASKIDGLQYMINALKEKQDEVQTTEQIKLLFGKMKSFQVQLEEKFRSSILIQRELVSSQKLFTERFINSTKMATQLVKDRLQQAKVINSRLKSNIASHDQIIKQVQSRIAEGEQNMQLTTKSVSERLQQSNNKQGQVMQAASTNRILHDQCNFYRLIFEEYTKCNERNKVELSQVNEEEPPSKNKHSEIQQLKTRLEYLQELARFHDLQIPSQQLNEEQENKACQVNNQINQSIKSRVQKNLLANNKKQQTSQVKQQFTGYNQMYNPYNMSYQDNAQQYVQQNVQKQQTIESLFKQSKNLKSRQNINNAYAAYNMKVGQSFDELYSHSSLKLTKNIVVNASDRNSSDQIKLAVFSSSFYANQATDVYFRVNKCNFNFWVGIYWFGRYSNYGLQKSNPQSIGTFLPKQHHYALLNSSTGIFKYKVGNVENSVKYAMRIKEGNVIKLEFDSSFNSLSISHYKGQQGQANFQRYLNLIDPQNYSFVIGIDGPAQFEEIGRQNLDSLN